MEKKIIKDRIYISGPITGLSREEYTGRFMKAEQVLREHGYVNIVNPVRLLPARWPWVYKILGYRLTLFYDLWHLTRCRRIYKMPGWKESRGAQIESCFAFHFFVSNINKKLKELIDAAIMPVVVEDEATVLSKASE